jgi:hypothetical protein
MLRELGTRIDAVNRFGMMPAMGGGAPDPRAVRLYEALSQVRCTAMSSAAFCDDPVTGLVPELAALLADDADRAAIAADALALALTVSSARFVDRPLIAMFQAMAWLGLRAADAECVWPWEPDFVRHPANNQPRWFAVERQRVFTGAWVNGRKSYRMRDVEIDGRRNGRLVPGAFRKPLIAPDPRPLMEARIEVALRLALLAALPAIAQDVLGLSLALDRDTPCPVWSRALRVDLSLDAGARVPRPTRSAAASRRADVQ